MSYRYDAWNFIATWCNNDCDVQGSVLRSKKKNTKNGQKILTRLQQRKTLMKNIKFEKLVIQNFLSIGKPVTIDFTKGINIITGENKDKQDENGVGKTSIINALYFSLFGETLSTLNKEYIVNNIAKKNCKVDLYFQINQNGIIKNYHIERGLAPSFCKIRVDNNEDKSLSTIPATNLYILNLINTTQPVFKNTITMSMNNTIPFMAQKKNEKRQFIEGILRLEIFTAMNKVAKENFDAIFKNYETNLTLFQEIENNIKNYEIRKLDDEQKKQQIIKDFESKIIEKETLIQDIKSKLIQVDQKQIKIIEDKLQKIIEEMLLVNKNYNIVINKLAELNSILTLNKQQLNVADDTILKLKEEYQKYPIFDLKIKTIDEFSKLIIDENTYIDNLKNKNIEIQYLIKDLQKENITINSIGNVCSKCKRPFDIQDITKNKDIVDTNNKNIIKYEQEIRDNNTKIANSTLLVKKTEVYIKLLQFKEQKNTLEKEIQRISTDLESYKSVLSGTESNQNRLKLEEKTLQQDKNNILIELEAYKHNITLITNYTNEIDYFKNTINNQKTSLNPFDDLIMESKVKRDYLQIKIDDSKEKIAIYDVIKHIVSDTGLKPYIIKKIITILNDRLNYYLNIMDSNCKITFDEYFDDTIVNDRGIECDYQNFSGGERKRIDLACLFAFMDTRRIQGDVSFNLAFYDELLDSALSTNGSIKVFDILKERLNLYNESSYIITHRKENLKNPNITDIIYLEKSNGITKLKEKQS